MKPLVSICSITYNHAAYLQEAMDSWLQQRTPFDVEIVVSDDASTDGTQDLLRRFQEQYPDRVRLLLNSQNIGVAANFKQAIDACRGKYIAICEGDDYWTDPEKLALQVGILEKNPDVAICFHRVEVVFTGVAPYAFRDYNAETPEVSDFDLLVKGNYIHTPSVMFRSGLIGDWPQGLVGLKMADWPLHLLNARFGGIRFIPREMAAYRISSVGTWSSTPKSHQIHQIVQMLQALLPAFSGRQAMLIRQSIAVYSRYLMKLLLVERKFSGFLQQAPRLTWHMIRPKK